MSLKFISLIFSNRLASSDEQKNLDVAPAIPAVATTTSVLTLLNGCLQGTSATTRLGRRITMKSIYIRGNLQLDTTTTGFCPVRILVVYDKQANGAAPVATDILVTDTINAQNNLSNSRRFVTLFDEVVPVIGTAGPQAAHVKLYKKLQHQVEFNSGNAGTIADIQTGSVYSVVFANNRTAVATILSGLVCRIRFTDN